MQFLARTDLALEDYETDRNDNVIDYEIKGIKVQKIILDPTNSKKYRKKEGVYYTVTSDIVLNLEHDNTNKLSNVLSSILEEIYDSFGLTQSSYVLVVGLGNNEITPDSLGPKVTKNIFVTKHISDLGKLEEGLGILGAVSFGVMGQTGIESSDIIKAVVSKTKPDLVLVVDALASRSLHRVNRTIQISTAGINPGSGVGNKRKEISKKTLGVPVIAIGIPTVVDVASIFVDTMKFVDGDREIAEEDIREALDTEELNYIVTSKEVDEYMVIFGEVISKAINVSIHNLDVYD